MSTTRWNSRARWRRSGFVSVRRRSQSEPIFTWVTSSASIQSSQNSSTGSPDSSPNSFIVLNTSIARPSSARLTPQRRSTGSGLHAAEKRNVLSVYSPISVPMWSPSLSEISQWRASSQHWRAMSSFSWKGASVSSKSKHVRPAPSSAWISPTKMPCINERERSAAAGRSVAIFAGPVLRAAILAPRGSKIRSSILERTKRSSRASSDSGSIFFMRLIPPAPVLPGYRDRRSPPTRGRAARALPGASRLSVLSRVCRAMTE